MLRWEIIKGGLTPVGQPLDKVVNKVFKGYLRDIYDMWALNSPINKATGAPNPPTWQKCATWVIEAWGKVLEDLCAKVWTACGYKTKNELASDQVTETAAYIDEQVSRLVQDEVIDDEYINFHDLALIGPDSHFPEEDNECDE